MDQFIKVKFCNDFEYGLGHKYHLSSLTQDSSIFGHSLFSKNFQGISNFQWTEKYTSYNFYFDEGSH